ncbi:radical SAM/SPASM domain-containing protein [Cytophagales bacterium WSM2-2]|nr:radical SAM/SPASM domain-containing protein [Cytophagales bacterium WSM2-2]
MCDIWKANSEKKEIAPEELARHIDAFGKLGVKRVALSGGEALMHSDLWRLCAQLKSIGAKISLLSTGVTLKINAKDVVTHVDDVIVSLDGSREMHNTIRNIPSAYEKLSEGVKAIKELNPSFPVTGRCVLQKQNFRDFNNIIRSAKEIGMDQISFLAADVSSSAFNHTLGVTDEKKVEIALTMEETVEMETILKKSFLELKEVYDQKFIAESPTKMLSLVQHYRAMFGKEHFPKKKCNAPWVSAVIESTGDVLPCFFHKPYGNIYKQEFTEIVNSKEAIAFRKNLNMAQDATCQRCVCSLYV